jgi:hypothetical protein
VKRAAIAIGLTAVLLGVHDRDAAAQNDRFDGTYAGLQTLAEKGPTPNYSQCLRGPFKRSLVVRGATATYTYNPTYQGTVTATVSADGDVRGSDNSANGGVNLAGRIADDTFTGEVWSLYCTYSVQLKRRQ